MNLKKTFLSIIAFGALGIFYAQNLTLTSEDLIGQGTKKIEFSGFGCNGENVSPELSWSGAPEGTRSFAITVYDPDAPTGSGWWHWLVVNLPSDTKSLKSGAGNLEMGSLPKGALATINDYGISDFGGPCPPVGHGDHTYIFTIYALDVEKLDVTSNTNAAVVGYNINSHTLQKSSLVVYYKR